MADGQGAEAEAEEGRDGGWREALEILEMIVRCTQNATSVLFRLRLTLLGTSIAGGYWAVLLLEVTDFWAVLLLLLEVTDCCVVI